MEVLLSKPCINFHVIHCVLLFICVSICSLFCTYLLSETQPFVDKLFEAINNKSYLPQPEQPSSVVKVEKDEQKKEEVMFL